MEIPRTFPTQIARRTFLGGASLGIGSAALTGLLVDALRGATPSPRGTGRPSDDRDQTASSGVVNPLHHPPRARRVIFLCMAGGPSQFETFDEKPVLAKMNGQPMPASVTAGQPIAQLQGQQLVCFGPQKKFIRYGKSGQAINEFLPFTGTIADDICIIRSMQTEQINHDPAHTFMNTGTSISGRPSMGSWITYGLGSESADLPGFVVMSSIASTRSPQPIASRQWHSGFLPGRFQGVVLNSIGDPVHYVKNPPGVTRAQQRELLDTVERLNRLRNREVQNVEIETRISQYELAFRMQMSVPELVDISSEPQHVLDSYGVQSADGSYAYNCLVARRLAERGVRFIQLYHRGWDHHGNLVKHMTEASESTDRATAALVNDLKQRGLLDDTLVIWGGEFGRTPMAQGNKGDTGRDHHIRGFSMWAAGGGVRPGITHGATDELGYHAVDNVVHVHDLHATMLHLLGIDHTRLTYRYQGRDFRLTDVHGRVVREILA
jgi:hypothetical protein